VVVDASVDVSVVVRVVGDFPVVTMADVAVVIGEATKGKW